MLLTGSHGLVDSFDAEVGLGHVTDEQGRRWMFHCTAIADGSRDIAVGAEVTFDVAAAGPGRWEARRLSPRSSGDSASS